MFTIIHWWWFGLTMFWWRLRNAPEDRAILLTRQGHYYAMVLLSRRCITRDGEVFQYGKHIVLVPKGHPFESFEEERVLGVVDGELIATPFTGTGKMVDETLISNFMEGNAEVQLSESIENPSRGGLGFKQLRWVLLAIAILVIGIVIWRFIVPKMLGTMPVNAPTPTPTMLPWEPVLPVGSYLINLASYLL